jgi:hypothetical protein
VLNILARFRVLFLYFDLDERKKKANEDFWYLDREPNYQPTANVE